VRREIPDEIARAISRPVGCGAAISIVAGAIYLLVQRCDRARVREEIEDANRNYRGVAALRIEEARRGAEQARISAAAHAEQAAEDSHRQAIATAFAAMSPTAHVDAARDALAHNYDPSIQLGGDLDEAARQIAPVLLATPRDVAALAIQHEIDARRARSVRQEEAINSQLRVQFAVTLDARLVHAGFEVERLIASGPTHDVLRIDFFACGRVFFDRVLTPDVLANLRGIGFRRVVCSNGYDNWTQPL
jgi:hypothetical protein